MPALNPTSPDPDAASDISMSASADTEEDPMSMLSANGDAQDNLNDFDAAGSANNADLSPGDSPAPEMDADATNTLVI